MIPKLRFPEFKDAFQSISLQSIVDKPISYGIVQAGEEVPEGMPYIKSSDLNSEINLRCLSRTSQEIAFKYRRSEVKSGDIIFSLRGNLGTTRIVPDEIKVANLTQGTARISLNESFYNHHIHYTLSSPSIQRKIAAVSKGSTFKEITLDDLRKLSLYVPNNQLEQRKIAKLFIFVDQKINLLTKKKEALETYKKGLMQKIFSQELRFKREDGTDYAEWKPKPLKAILKERKTLSSDTDSIELVSLTKEGVVAKSDRYNREFLVKDASKKYKMTQLNDICYNPANLKFGVICRNTFGKALFSPIYVTFEVNNHLAENSFIELFVTSRNFIQKALKYQEGTVYERMAVKPNDLVKSVIQLPCVDEQKRIISLVEALDAKLETLHSTIHSTELLKKGLLQQMFV